MAILEFDAGRLREFLQLPETAEIVDARMDFGSRGRIQFKIEGAGYPTTEGHPLPFATCSIRSSQDAEGAIRVNPELVWSFAPTPYEVVASEQSGDQS